MKVIKSLLLTSVIAILSLLAASCSTHFSSSNRGDQVFVDPVLESVNKLTMDIDSEPITYTIDISTQEGRVKLNNISLYEAKQLAAVEALMVNRCATIFQPQFTHLMKGGKVLRVTIYGFPARYKSKE